MFKDCKYSLFRNPELKTVYYLGLFVRRVVLAYSVQDSTPFLWGTRPRRGEPVATFCRPLFGAVRFQVALSALSAGSFVSSFPRSHFLSSLANAAPRAESSQWSASYLHQTHGASNATLLCTLPHRQHGNFQRLNFPPPEQPFEDGLSGTVAKRCITYLASY